MQSYLLLAEYANIMTNSKPHQLFVIAYFLPRKQSAANIFSRPLKTIFQHKVCTDKLYADSFYKAQKSSHSSFEVICCRS